MKTVNISLALALGLAITLPVALCADVTTTAAPAAAKAPAKADPATQAMMKKSDCFTCHQVATKVIGPAYKDVAKKYAGVPGAEAKLVAKIKNGGSGNWGAVPMTAHPNLTDAQLHAIVKWVLAQK
jgi:cytochrome c